jgi:hypothetical protein
LAGLRSGARPARRLHAVVVTDGTDCVVCRCQREARRSAQAFRRGDRGGVDAACGLWPTVATDGRASELAPVADAAVAPKALTAVGAAIVRIAADGGYDRQEVYDAASRVSANVVIPPRKDAVPSRDPTLAERNKHIAHRKRVGKRQWRVDTGHHQQARVENTFYLHKRTFARGLRARTEEGQLVEVLTGCRILNRTLELGRPESIAIRV